MADCLRLGYLPLTEGLGLLVYVRLVACLEITKWRIVDSWVIHLYVIKGEGKLIKAINLYNN